MALPILAYLGYLGSAALFSVLASACSREKDTPSPPPSEPAPSLPSQTVLRVKKGDPAYPVYEQLKEAGLDDIEIDGVKEGPGNTWPPGPPLQVLIKAKSIGHPSHRRGDGQITDLDLFYTGNYFYLTKLSPEENKKWQDLLQKTFQEVGDVYFAAGKEKSGIVPPQACQSTESFQKAALWNAKNIQAQLILGTCRSDPKHYFQVLQTQPDNKEAKTSLEALYSERTRKDPKDTLAWMNLGYAYKVQGKLSEAKSSYLKALELNPHLMTARLELKEIYPLMNNFVPTDLEENPARRCPRIPGMTVRMAQGGVPIETPNNERRWVALWHSPYTAEMQRNDEEYWASCRH